MEFDLESKISTTDNQDDQGANDKRRPLRRGDINERENSKYSPNRVL